MPKSSSINDLLRKNALREDENASSDEDMNLPGDGRQKDLL